MWIGNLRRWGCLYDHRRIFSKKRTDLGSLIHRLSAFGRGLARTLRSMARYIQDRNTGQLLPAHEWHALYGKPVVRTHFIIGDIEPYQSPIDDRPIMSRRQHEDDLKRNGCRVYEGRAQEQKMADAHQEQADKDFDASLDVALRKTANDLEYKNVKPETRIKSAWLLGED